jgi:hypothetical protein
MTGLCYERSCDGYVRTGVSDDNDNYRRTLDTNHTLLYSEHHNPNALKH